MEQQRSENDNVLVHMSADEVKSFSRAQGGLDVNQELNMPQFMKLYDMLSDPEFKESMKLAIKGYVDASKEEQSKYSQELDQIADHTIGDENQIQEDVPGQSPEIQQLEAEGTRDDTELVLMPRELLYFFWENVPEEMREINPNTGYPQFGLLSFLGSLLGGVAGFFIGGPMGAAIGGGLGNFGGSYGDEMGLPEDQKSSFGSKLLNAGMSGGLGYLGGQYLPGLMGGGGAGSAASTVAQQAAQNAAPGLAALGLSPAAEVAAQGAAHGAGSWLTNSLPHLGMGALALGSMDDRNNHQNTVQQNKSAYDQYRNDVLKDYEERKFRHSNLYKGYTSPELMHNRQTYKKGGEVVPIREIAPIRTSQYIKGDEPGQADNIHVSIPKGSRVIDAISVAHLGDGNSEAGAKKLDELISSLPNEDVEQAMDVPCAIAAGEYVITPDKVSALGKGNIQDGHKLLDQFVKKLRTDKKHSINDIPSPTKDIKHYIGRNYKNILKRGA